jgi:hypothetical protein
LQPQPTGTTTSIQRQSGSDDDTNIAAAEDLPVELRRQLLAGLLFASDQANQGYGTSASSLEQPRTGTVTSTSDLKGVKGTSSMKGLTQSMVLALNGAYIYATYYRYLPPILIIA